MKQISRDPSAIAATLIISPRRALKSRKHMMMLKNVPTNAAASDAWTHRYTTENRARAEKSINSGWIELHVTLKHKHLNRTIWQWNEKPCAARSTMKFNKKINEQQWNKQITNHYMSIMSLSITDSGGTRLDSVNIDGDCECSCIFHRIASLFSLLTKS